MAIGDVSTSIISNFTASSIDTGMTSIVSTIGAISGAFLVQPFNNGQDCLLVGIQTS